MRSARLAVLLLAAAAFVGPALVALLSGCSRAGELCGSCPAGQVCGAGRCVPERAGCPTGSCDGRAVPSPMGPL